MEVSLINDIGLDGVALEIRVNHNEGQGTLVTMS
jgi:hypothetical protein